MEELEYPRIPARAVVISLGALAVPVASTLGLRADPYLSEMLLWLLALVPAFLLAYYRGWRGVATALAAGMVTLVATHIVLLAQGETIDNWRLLLGVVTSYTGIALGIGAVTDRLHARREEAARLALIDDLTRLPNRRAARFVLEKEFAAARRGRPLSVVMFDLDEFKQFNDAYGHVTGDEALRLFGTVLGSNTRRMNLSARYGGEEFVSLISTEPLDGVVTFAERVLHGLEDAHRQHPLTVSAGVAMYAHDMESEDDLLRAADDALYRAKSEGGNRVCVFQD